MVWLLVRSHISETNSEANLAVKEIFNGKFGQAKQILIEEFLDGEEMSFFIISDGISYKSLVLLKIIKEFLRVTKVRILVEWELLTIKVRKSKFK